MIRLLFILIFFIGCIKNPVPSDAESEYLFTTTNLEYDSVTSELSLYVEIENITLSNIIDSVWSELYNSKNILIFLQAFPVQFGIWNQLV